MTKLTAFLTALPARIARIKKALVPVFTTVATLVSLGVFSGPALAAAVAVLGLGASLGVYATRNAKAPEPAVAVVLPGGEISPPPAR